MPHAFDVGRRGRDIRLEPFKWCITGGLGPGRITLVRSVLESIQRSWGFHVLKECRKKPGHALALMLLLPEESGWTPT